MVHTKVSEECNNPHLILDLMIKAFMEYKDETPPSSALDETIGSISKALKEGEQALVCSVGSEPVGMVRFLVRNDDVYFYRLSVIPERRGRGIGKEILKSLEEYASKNNKRTMICKVRMTVPKNIKLYNSIGYSVYDEEVVHKPNGIKIKVVSMIKQL
ncbi:GNAT family N-acetyltransferase [Halobacillus naozhouensis]|uniref:GNAT family N-acetyltransferase n=1 Tax=Halobacillus naozhouensis TaxID=554880 RepID=A0ABY8IYY2_9BACI|nr:GNAT family N-acetyltransferase [Halobacillus naozhouensis]WFT74509.1 GNAT family N-acetyltransferase [Halobacillus naozhouensis]